MHVGNRYGIHNLGADLRPLALRVKANLQSGEQTAPNSLSLQNQTGEPWEIHEFKFYMRSQNPLEGHVAGGFMQAALALDSMPITDGFVPTWAMAPAHALDIERLSPYWATQLTSSALNMFGVQPSLREDGMYYWNLDHPLYVPPGSSIKVQFNHTGLNNVAATMGMTASGRVLPGTARPEKIRVPWISTWQSQMYEPLTSGSTQGYAQPEISQETQLNNPFDVELKVERFIGRINQVIQYISGTTQYTNVSDLFTGPYDQMFRVKQYDSTGNLIVPLAGGFRNVYGSRNRSWTVRHTMPPGAYNRVELTKIAAAAGIVINPGISTARVVQVRAQAQVSIVGWREESL